jgi:hypothetical protein
MTRPVPHPLQLLRETTHTLARPPQRCFRISAPWRLNQRFQVPLQGPIPLDRPFSSSTGPPNSSSDPHPLWRLLQLPRPYPNRTPRHPCRSVHQGGSPKAKRLRFRSSHDTSHPLIEVLLDQSETPTDDPFVHHSSDSILSTPRIWLAASGVSITASLQYTASARGACGGEGRTVGSESGGSKINRPSTLASGHYTGERAHSSDIVYGSLALSPV